MKSELKIDESCLDRLSNTLAERPGYLMRRCLQELSGKFTNDCSDIGITERQYDYLFVLDQVTTLTQGQLSKQLGIDRSTNTLVIGLLEEKGLVSRKVDKTDTRRKVVEITDAGRRTFNTAQKSAEAAVSNIKGYLADQEYQQFLRSLVKILGAITHENTDQNLTPCNQVQNHEKDKTWKNS